jgi:hypothetical protein
MLQDSLLMAFKQLPVTKVNHHKFRSKYVLMLMEDSSRTISLMFHVFPITENPLELVLKRLETLSCF